MFLARLDNELIFPTKNNKARCPLCDAEVIAKCGDINIHHWAHKKAESCDSWTEPETYWHKSWKESFPIQNREFVFKRDGKKHFADLYTDSKIVIELQNSSISSKTIEERENFYGEKMLWVINGGIYRERISFLVDGDPVDEENNHSYQTFIRLCHNKVNEYLDTNKEFEFYWDYPIRSWKNAKRPVFIDFNEKHILWFTKGIGEGSGKFRVYSKKEFFKKYKGDYETFKSLNCNKNLFLYKDTVDQIDHLINGYHHKTKRKLVIDFMGYKEYETETIVGENFEYTTYEYGPFLSLKVCDKLSLKFCLQKSRWKNFIIPNSNSKGLIFLFCFNKNKTEKIGLHINFTPSVTIGEKILELIKKDFDNSNYKIGDEWVLDYIASIPLNKIDLEKIASSVVEHLKDELKRKSIIEII